MKVPTALNGCQVRRTSFDYQVRLNLVGRDQNEGYRVDAELVIETPFLLRDTAGQWHELHPGTGSSLAQILDLFMTSINDVHIGQQGALSITFDHGAELFIGPRTPNSSPGTSPDTASTQSSSAPAARPTGNPDQTREHRPSTGRA